MMCKNSPILWNVVSGMGGSGFRAHAVSRRSKGDTKGESSAFWQPDGGKTALWAFWFWPGGSLSPVGSRLKRPWVGEVEGSTEGFMGEVGVITVLEGRESDNVRKNSTFFPKVLLFLVLLSPCAISLWPVRLQNRQKEDAAVIQTSGYSLWFFCRRCTWWGTGLWLHSVQGRCPWVLQHLYGSSLAQVNGFETVLGLVIWKMMLVLPTISHKNTISMEQMGTFWTNIIFEWADQTCMLT